MFVSVAGGARAPDPAADLATALASAFRGGPLPGPMAAMGEIGLTGELRPVGHVARRLRVAVDHSVVRAVTGPLGDAEHSQPRPGEVAACEELRDAIRAVFRPREG